MVNAVFTLWHKHMVKFLRSGEAALGMLLEPILWLVLFGVGMQNLLRGIGALAGGTAALAGGYLGFMAPGIITLSALAGAIAGGAVLLDERLRGIIREYLTAPIPRSSILLGSALSTVTRGLLQAAVITGVGLLLGARPTANPLHWLAAAGMLVLFTLGVAGLALAVAARVRSTLGYHGLIALNLPLLFASSALYPLGLMPGWVRAIALANPATYTIDALRQLLYGIRYDGQIETTVALAVCATFAAGGLGFAVLSFNSSVRARGGAV